jgi:hypothetical protein
MFLSKAAQMKPNLYFVGALILGLLGLGMAAGAETGDYILRIKNHRFIPEELEIPAGQKIRLIVKNEDPTPEEFESHSLNREKIVAGGHQILVYIGPLDPGKYDFFGDFFPKTAQGIIIAK